ncbi:MAG: zinc-ribbon domain-containing protein [Roseburia hominis]|nr:zinc-ribbon domain-containing protein [Roseburia hominis]
MYCTKCGNEIKLGNKFCVKCGAPVVIPAQPQKPAQASAPQQVTEQMTQAEESVQAVPQQAPVPQQAEEQTQAEKPAQAAPQQASEKPAQAAPQQASEPKKQGKGLVVALVIILVLVVIGGACVIGYLLHENNKESAWEENDYEDQDDSAILQTEETESEGTESAPAEDTEAAAATAASEAEEYVPDLNIHRYEFFIDDCSWYAAMQKAKESGGYLVRIESPEEYDYILSEIARGGYESIQFRIGARRNQGELSYYWVDENNNTIGSPIQVSGYWCENEWMDGEPSYQDGENEENCVDIFYYSAEDRWVWNDVPDDIISIAPGYSGRLGYIVEYED